ncbi:MAG: four helix bundle protein [Anaerolinea sp.]|nr:four helix bundle protein [Anaerolinea sp.]
MWKVEAYRLALFVSDLSWHDTTKLAADRRTLALSDQLYRSVGSIGANVAEGYSRGTGRDRARFYEYALGSAREGRDWYYKGRHILGEKVAQHRISLVTQIIRLLLAMIPRQRRQALREEQPIYQVVSEGLNHATLHDLLSNIPLSDPPHL